MKSKIRIAFLYCIFATISTAVNLFTQIIVIKLLGQFNAVEISILAGTATGLPVKYILDKRYIFHTQTSETDSGWQTSLRYVFTGIFTTGIFWAIEYSFHLLFAEDCYRYLGGILGLSVGFIIKYRIDKKFVFISKSSNQRG